MEFLKLYGIICMSSLNLNISLRSSQDNQMKNCSYFSLDYVVESDFVRQNLDFSYDHSKKIDYWTDYFSSNRLIKSIWIMSSSEYFKSEPLESFFPILALVKLIHDIV